MAAPAKKRRQRSTTRTAPGMDEAIKRLAKRCRDLREAAELTQQRAAERAGIAITYLQIVERGTSNPSFSILVSLAKAYGMTLSELLKGV